MYRPTPRGGLGGLARGGAVQAHTQGGGWGHLAGGGVQAHTWGGGCPGPHPGGRVGASGWGGVSRPTPGGCTGPNLGGGVWAHTGGGLVYPIMHRGRPPRRQLLLRAVRILLECILVILLWMVITSCQRYYTTVIVSLFQSGTQYNIKQIKFGRTSMT